MPKYRCTGCKKIAIIPVPRNKKAAWTYKCIYGCEGVADMELQEKW